MYLEEKTRTFISSVFLKMIKIDFTSKRLIVGFDIFFCSPWYYKLLKSWAFFFFFIRYILYVHNDKSRITAILSLSMKQFDLAASDIWAVGSNQGERCAFLKLLVTRVSSFPSRGNLRREKKKKKKKLSMDNVYLTSAKFMDTNGLFRYPWEGGLKGGWNRG